MGLQDSLPGQPPLVAVDRLFADWFGFAVDPLDGSCDSSGVPRALQVIAELSRAHPDELSRKWQAAGSLRDDGQVVVHGRPHDMWCSPGSISNPVYTYGPFAKTVHRAADQLDTYLRHAVIFDAQVSAPAMVFATLDSVDDAATFLSPYRRIFDFEGSDGGGGFYAGEDVLLNYLPSIGTIWPLPRVRVFGRDVNAVETTITDRLTVTRGPEGPEAPNRDRPK